ncbi:FHA domain-containing protein [Mycolicibacterium aubagnense]|uniref:FHA domain-containing protein n=1 Tax=Mycolicibacterium aubagnense TaxID=319707 RepID=UPI0010FE1085|nr:FHA domain-containing protein [Mycolicibacterium aubagnense]TLH67861.1 peptide-binding protein [Mycolicibacterium aubagnense]WGI31995.1 FHA domain-containing protein [Mycolicibacterium aubagnense]
MSEAMVAMPRRSELDRPQKRASETPATQRGFSTATDGDAGEQGAGPSDWAVLVVTQGPHPGTRFLLDSPVTSIGRLRDSDVFLDDITVSRRHAEIRWNNGAFTLADVGGLTCTHLNGKLVDAVAPLNTGDVVEVGESQLVFLTHPAVPAAWHRPVDAGHECESVGVH